MEQCRQQALEIEVRHFVEICLVADIFLTVKDVLESLVHPWFVQHIPINFVSHVARTVDKPEIACVQAVKNAFPPKLPDHRFVFAQQTKIGDDRFERNNIVSRLVGTIYRRFNALLKVSDQVACITTEYFVPALSTEDHFNVTRGKFRDHKLWK